MEFSDVTITAILTIAGTILLEIIKRWLVRNKDKTDLATTLRGELRQDVTRLREDAKQAEQDADDMRERYYKARNSELAALTALNTANERLRDAGLPTVPHPETPP